MKRQEFYSGNSITIRWAVTIYEPNAAQSLVSLTMEFIQGCWFRRRANWVIKTAGRAPI
jgi:hypothetical protein